MLVNAFLAIIPAVSLLLVYAVLSFVWFKWITPVKTPEGRALLSKVNRLVIIVCVLWAGASLFSSPLVRPTTDVHDKGAELIKYKQAEEVSLPVLEDKSRQSEEVIIEGTPLLEEALKVSN